MIKEGAPPNYDWPTYNVEIRGRAKSYEDAEEGLQQLETKRYAYSTDDEIVCQRKAQQEKKYYQMKKPSTNVATIENILEEIHVDITDTAKKTDKENENNESDKCYKTHRMKCTRSSSVKNSRDHSVSSEESVTESYDRKNNLHKSRKSTQYSLVKRTTSQGSRKILSDKNNYNDHEELSQFPQLDRESPLRKKRKFENQESRTDISDDDGIHNNYKKKIKKTKKKLNGSKTPQSSNLSFTSSSQPTRSLSSQKTRDQEPVLKSSRNSPSCSIHSSGSSPSSQHHGSQYASTPRSTRTGASFTGHNRYHSQFEAIHEEDELDSQGSLKELILKYYYSILKEIAHLKGLLVDCNNKIKKLEERFGNIAEVPIGNDNSEILQSIPLPCSTMLEFEQLNDSIRVNAEYRTVIKGLIWKSVNTDRSMVRCLGDAIRKFVSTKVGNLLVPIKPTLGKIIFKHTPLHDLIEGVYSLGFGNKNRPLSTKVFEKAVQGVLHNTNSWKREDTEGRKNADKMKGENSDISAFDEDVEDS